MVDAQFELRPEIIGVFAREHAQEIGLFVFYLARPYVLSPNIIKVRFSMLMI